MVHDPLIAVVAAQPVVQTTDHAAALPAPTIQQEHVADNVFSPEAHRAAAAFLGVQTGLALLGHIIAEAAPSSAEMEHLPRPKKDEKPAPEA
jgi:hypothetical protein